MKTETRMHDMTAVMRALDRLLEGAPEPMLDLLADDVEFEVAGAGDVPGCRKASGKQPVTEYFTALGGLVAFWQMDYTTTGRQVIAWGTESFTVEGCELEGGCEFALVFEVDEGMITRFMVIEDLPSFIRGSGSVVEASRIDLGSDELAEDVPDGEAVLSTLNIWEGWTRKPLPGSAYRSITTTGCSGSTRV